ncbi:MAG TPA: DUF4350 domain-containing protein [Gemmatimonadales bacterium]|nr:DUF4350 domain-containing protein [Gemmatimonadales bacterium]
MRPRSEVALAVSLLGVLVLIAGVLGRRPAADTDERPSTFSVAPGGSRGLLDALQRLRIPVQRFRERSRELARLSASPRRVLVILGPSAEFSAPERTAVLAFAEDADLILAGRDAESLMRCFGYRVNRRILDSAAVAPPGVRPGPRAPWVHATLAATRQRVVVDSSRASDVDRISCVVPPLAGVDTLLQSTQGRPVALRLRRADRPREVVLVADEELFRNRALRRTEAGAFALGLFAGRYDRVVFEEYHHGYGAAGSLSALTIDWSRRSPWGRLVWQAAAVGLLALLFGAVRFGPPRPGIPRVRRSPLEHLRALAAALASARGHDVAIGAMVRGLRRRLVPPGLRSRGDWRAWLTRLGGTTLSPRARDALALLDSLTRPGQPSSSVLRAANAVEDVWEDLKP